MLRALNAMHYSSDEEINEDEAFNSEDEAKYGKFFKGKSNDYVSECMTNKFLGIQVPVLKESGESNVVKIEVSSGSKLVLSSVCPDVPSNGFRQLRLLVRCLYENISDEKEMPWMCLCNFAGQPHLPPSTTLALEIVGPCIVEWKIQVEIYPAVADQTGSINIFGQIVPTDSVSGGSVFVDHLSHSEEFAAKRLSETAKTKAHKEAASDGKHTRDKVAASKTNGMTHDQHMQNDDEDEDEKLDVPKTSKENNTEQTKKQESKAIKRKLDEDCQQDKADKNTKSDDAAASKSPETPKENNTKLTKKQRKQLAQEKTKQLEITLNAAREAHSETPKSKKKKKKKQSNNEEPEPISKPTSLTRERRLPGGILVSDILIGTGTTVSSGRKISLHYTGSLTNGKVFDKNYSRTQPLQFRQGTGEVIRGLERGLEGMRVGGERLITVPAALGYGEKGMGGDIPPDSDLVFEVKVLKVG